MSEQELLNVRNFGQKSLDELRQRLIARGYIVAPISETEPNDQEESEPEDTEEAGAAMTEEKAS